MKPKPEKPTTTFDLGDGQIQDSTFEDVESSADRLVTARGGMERSDWRRISHTPFRRAGGGVNWTAIGAIAGVIAAIAAVAALFPM